MCGIAGVLFVDERTADETQSIVNAMCRRQAQRGPDSAGTWSDRHVGIGAVRLAITGGVVGGSQPLRDPHGGISVFNGEIYNAATLATHLDGALWNPGFTDGRALVGLLCSEGPSALSRARGPFALARFDPKAGCLYLVRDAVGKKPLYLAAIDGGWAFASTLKALHAATGPLHLREEAIYEYLLYRSVGGYATAFRDVVQVPPGGWVALYLDGRRREGRWWQPPSYSDAVLSERDTRALVSDAILLRHTPEHTAGIFLSGGLDSSIVAATLASTHPEEGLWALSIGYDVNCHEDETDYAADVAAYTRLPHEKITLNASEVPSLLEEAAQLTEDPIQDPVTLPTLKLAKYAVRRTKVVHTGDGSDEIWGGYARFDDAPPEIDRYLQRTMIFTSQELGLACAPPSYLEGLEPACDALEPLDRILRLEVTNRMRNYHLARVDKICMGVGLEPRSPFLDIRVVNEGLALPASIKRPSNVPKGLLIQAFRDLLPSWLLQRRKQPFSLPIAEWLGGSLNAFAQDTLRTPNAFVGNFIDPVALLETLDDCGKPAEQVAHRIWALLQIEAWHRAVASELGAGLEQRSLAPVLPRCSTAATVDNRQAAI